MPLPQSQDLLPTCQLQLGPCLLSMSPQPSTRCWGGSSLPPAKANGAHAPFPAPCSPFALTFLRLLSLHPFLSQAALIGDGKIRSQMGVLEQWFPALAT